MLQLNHQTVFVVVDEIDYINKSTGGLWPIVCLQLQFYAGGFFVIRAWGL